MIVVIMLWVWHVFYKNKPDTVDELVEFEYIDETDVPEGEYILPPDNKLFYSTKMKNVM